MIHEELQQYKAVQSIAKETIEFFKSFIHEGLSAREIKEAAEKHMNESGVESFWYYDIGAFVFVGEQTTLSVSGREYRVSDLTVQSEDLVTVDLAPERNGYWGDFARSFIVENGKVVEPQLAHLSELVEGIEIEKKFHKEFQDFVTIDTSFKQASVHMSAMINALGFENLDLSHNQNLGHSIVKQKDDRIYLEAGNTALLKSVNLFTFEPHIKKNGGKYGFKHEEIYYFGKGKLEVL